MARTLALDVIYLFVNNINMKKCCCCGKNKDESEFWKLSKSLDWLQYRCKDCKKLYDNWYYWKRSYSYKIRKREISKARRKKILAYIKSIALERWCCICWYNKHIAALQFHHRNQLSKKDAVSELIRKWYSLDKIKEEIDKCDVVCANCHLIITSEQLWWY